MVLSHFHIEILSLIFTLKSILTMTGGVLYMARPLLPARFLDRIRNSDEEFHKLLSATKIGQSEDWSTFHEKMQNLQTHLSFAVIEYYAFKHNLDPRIVVSAMHLLFV